MLHFHIYLPVCFSFVSGASWLSWGLGKGATAGGYLISKGADKLKKHIKPVEDPKEFDAKYQKGAHYARKVTGGVVTVSYVCLSVTVIRFY